LQAILFFQFRSLAIEYRVEYKPFPLCHGVDLEEWDKEVDQMVEV